VAPEPSPRPGFSQARPGVPIRSQRARTLRLEKRRSSHGWMAGHLGAPITAAVRSSLTSDPISLRGSSTLLDTPPLIYAAVGSREGRASSPSRQSPPSQDMGPAEDRCPPRILDLLSEPSKECAPVAPTLPRASGEAISKEGADPLLPRRADVHQRRSSSYVRVRGWLAVSNRRRQMPHPQLARAPIHVSQ
jgi:hypothetical protein